jgi:hypothetical protein
MKLSKLLNIIQKKFPELMFNVNSMSDWTRITSIKSNIKFYTYTRYIYDDPDNLNPIWYISLYYPEREIEIPNTDTELFLDHIKDIILDSFKIETLMRDVSYKVHNVNTFEWKRDFELKKILDI